MHKAKDKAIKKKTGEASHKMYKTSTSRDYCRHCGKETSRRVTHESGHNSYDCEKSPHSHSPVKLER